ncbi:MAG: FAD-binding oxidoreductase [Actinobacteria bacterium]|nr:FAD-binding oxidoreductase [Actinomycetota bacterium]
MAERADVAIVGAGVTGLSVALEVSRRRDWRVVVVDRGYAGSGNSGRNVARIRAMQLTPELTRFAVEARRKHRRLTDELGLNTLYWRSGYAWVLYDDEEVERMAGLLPMHREHGLRPRLYDGRGAIRRLPVLAGGEPPAGALVGRDAIVHHDAVVHALRRRCREAGVVLHEGRAATGVILSSGSVAGLLTASGEVRAPLVVNAAEGWAAEVSRWAGIAVPNVPVRREVLVTEPSRPFTGPAVTFYRPVEGWFNQTLRGELVAGVVAPDEPAGLDMRSSFGFLTRTATVLLRKAPRLGHLRVIRQWAGVYELTPDRMPLVGPVASVPGFVQANGYSGRGMAFAPLVAELLAEWLVSGRRPELLAPFDPDRFAPGERVVTGRDYYAGYARARGGPRA